MQPVRWSKLFIAMLCFLGTTGGTRHYVNTAAQSETLSWQWLTSCGQKWGHPNLHNFSVLKTKAQWSTSKLSPNPVTPQPTLNESTRHFKPIICSHLDDSSILIGSMCRVIEARDSEIQWALLEGILNTSCHYATALGLSLWHHGSLSQMLGNHRWFVAGVHVCIHGEEKQLLSNKRTAVAFPLQSCVSNSESVVFLPHSMSFFSYSKGLETLMVNTG